MVSTSHVERHGSHSDTQGVARAMHPLGWERPPGDAVWTGGKEFQESVAPTPAFWLSIRAGGSRPFRRPTQ